MRLFKMECKKIAGSILYWLFVLALIVVCVPGYYRKVETELGRTDDPNSVFYIAPDGNYGNEENGVSREEMEQNMMAGAADRLLGSYRTNQYEYYPFGYIKTKTMSEQEQAVIRDYLVELTGLSEQEIAGQIGESNNESGGENGESNSRSGGQTGGGEDARIDDISISGKGAYILAPGKGETNAKGQFIAEPEDWRYSGNGGHSLAASEKEDGGYHIQVSFDRFKEIMREIDQMIGRNSYFSWGMLTLYYFENDMEDAPVTEQQHLEFYRNDRVTGAFARYYCDSISTVLLFLPAFPVIDLMMKDKRHKMRGLIYPKTISGAKLIGIRYLASVGMAMVPILIFPVKSQISLMAYCSAIGIRADAFAFIKYILAWILPTVLFITAVSLLVTVLLENYFAVLSAGFLWLAGRPSIDKIAGGNYGLSDLIIRHNTLKGYGRMMENIRSLTVNRLLITGIALVFAVLAVFVYNAKRRGGMTFESRKFSRNSRV